MATEHLLEGFPPVSTAAWEAAIARDLKGADYEKKLIWRSDEGLAVKPYYRAEDLKELAFLNAAPGEFPYRRGARATGDWQIREEIDASNAEEANRAAFAAVAAGAEGIAFSGFLVRSSGELSSLLANLDEVQVHFERGDERLIRLLLEQLGKRPRAAGISTGCDALESVEFAADAIHAAPAGFVPFTIHGEAFEEAGGTAVEEVGFALAAGVDFLAAIEERGAAVDGAAAAIEFSFAIGSNYFFQIAKLRAFRMVWAQAVKSFGGSHAGARARIAARTSRWNKTVYDPHVNILRSTTEAMAAVLGGADAVIVAPFDACYRQPDEASRRLARNTQLLLKHEAWLGRVADTAGGSYYVEALTDFLARESWKRMQQIEAQGGYRKAQAEGAIVQALERSLAAREQAVATRRRVLTGTNQYANPAERALERIDSERVSRARRGARIYEELRLRTERHVAAGGKTPRVLLAEIGDVKMHMARANFAANFFACAGFEIAARRFWKAADIASAEGDLIVLCSSDAEYAALAAKLMPKLKALDRSTPVIVAGRPENAAELMAVGIAGFVHASSHPVEVLTGWQEQLGMKD
ncbi:MAG: methylmalonyl-CoA mutase family protein [Terracidiphilus sp.]|jgi:methylmalonyl-CoA mutase